VNRRHAAAVFSRQLGNRLASRITLGNLALLAMIEDRFAAKDRASGLRTPDAFITSGSDQLALELVQTTHNLQDEFAVRRAGIEPWIIECSDVSASCLDLIEEVQQIPNGAR